MKKNFFILILIALVLVGCNNTNNENYDEKIEDLVIENKLLKEQIEEMSFKILELQDRVTMIDESLIEGVDLNNGKYLYTNLDARMTLVFNDELPEHFETYAHRNHTRIQFNDGFNIEPYVLRFYLQDKRITEDTDLYFEYDSTWNLHYEPSIGYIVTDDEVIGIIEQFKCNLVVNNVKLFECPGE